jgi:hypothetical protein
VARKRLGTEQRWPRRALVAARRDQNSEVAEAGLACPFDQRERRSRVRRDERGRPPGESCRDRTFVSGLDLEQRERQPLALLRESPRGRRQAFALGERVLERGQAFPRETRVLPERLALRVRPRTRQQRLLPETL